MCAGKSRLGRLAAQRLGWPLADSDKLLEERLGEPIASFFDREGEQAFRDREQELVLELLAAPGPAIVPLGGGAVERRAGARRARRSRRRARRGGSATWPGSAPASSGRPLARDRERFAQLYAARRPLYESVAGAVLADGAEKTPAFVDALRPRQRRAAHGVVGAGLPRVGRAPACWTRQQTCCRRRALLRDRRRACRCSSTASGSRRLAGATLTVAVR